MAGIQIVTDLDEVEARKVLIRAANHQEFKVERVSEDELFFQKGSYGMSILFGAFVLYCEFKVYISINRNDDTRIELERNNPWWTGLIGIRRVKTAAKNFMDLVEDEIERIGGEVLNRKEF